MKLSILTYVTCISVFWIFAESCTHAPDHLYGILLTEFDTSFRFLRHNESFEKSRLHMIYEWKPYIPYRGDFDGYLYKFIDRDETNHTSVNRYPGFADVDFDPKACLDLNSTVYANGSSNPVECNLPCEKYFPPVCGHGKLCSLLRKGYKVLSPKAKTLEFHVEFGHVYDLNVYVYQHWYTGKSRIFDGISSVTYCKDELITNHNVSHNDAAEYCNKSIDYGKSARIMGPVSHFEKYLVIRNLTNNRATVTFRWKIPYDIAPNVSLLSFSLYVSRGQLSEKQIKVKDDPLEPNPPMTKYFEATITDVEFKKKALISISPFIKELGCTKECRHYGASMMEYFEIDDINACDPDNGVGRYCDDRAMCIDQPSNSSISAKCSCHEGLTGNGISTKWHEGTGCEGDYDSCPLPETNSNISCHPDVICTNTQTPAKIFTCKCPHVRDERQQVMATNHVTQTPNGNFTRKCPTSCIDDGYVDGSECSRRNLIIGLCLGIPLFVLLLIVAGCWYWKSRNTINRMTRLNEENL